MVHGVGQIDRSSASAQPQPTVTTGSSGGRSVALGNGASASAAQGTRAPVHQARTNVLARTIQVGPQDAAAPASALGGVRTPGIGGGTVDKEAQLTRQLAGLDNLIDNLDHASLGYVSSKSTLMVLEEVYDLLSVAPAGSEEAEALVEDLDKACATLDVTLEKMGTAGRTNESVKALRVPLKALADEARAAVDLHKRQLDAGIQSNPLSEKACFACKLNWAQGALAMLDTQAKRVGNDTDAGRILANAKTVIAAHVKDLEGHTDLKPLDKKAISTLMGSDRSGAKATLVHELPGFMRKGFNLDRPSQAAAKAFAQSADFKAGSAFDLPASQAEVSEEMMLEAVLTRAFEQAGIPTDRVHADLNEARKAHLNGQTWSTVTAEVQLQHGKSTYSLTSTIKPQSQIDGQFKDMNGGGVNCHMTQAHKHCANVAVSTAEIGGQKIFEGIRHGILSPYDISDKKIAAMRTSELATMIDELLLQKPDGQPAAYTPLGKDATAIAKAVQGDKGLATLVADSMRAEATYRRGLDVATTALVSDGAKLQRALNGETVAITLNSLSLVTPCAANKKEKHMLSDQVAAWGRLSADPQPKTVIVKDAQGRDVPVKITVQARAFNFGVNQLALSLLNSDKLNPVTSSIEALSGWEASDKTNRIAMDSLIGTQAQRGADGLGGEVRAWLDRTDADAQTKETVTALAKQIGELWDSGAYRTAGKEPYKMVSRLAMLTDLMGDKACWNCKSGKDRTGNLDTEVKYLAAQIHLTGRVPEPDRDRSGEEQANFFRIGRFGGNHEMQVRNTGVPGYKYDEIAALTAQMGEARMAVMKGLSKFIGS